MERSENKVKIKFKKLNKRAEIPFYAKDGDAGMDLVATTLVRTSKFFEYGTDLAMEIPKGYVGLLSQDQAFQKQIIFCATPLEL